MNQIITNIEQRYDSLYPWKWSYLQPVHWPFWLLLGLLYLAGRLPMPAFIAMGKLLGRTLLVGKRKRIARRNLELCFPELSTEQRDALLKKNLAYAGIALLEPGLFWFASAPRVKRISRLEGLEHYHKLKESGKPILICGLHMMCVEAIGRIMCGHITSNQIYRINKNQVYDYMCYSRRQSYPSKPRLIPRQNIKDFMRLLQDGQTCSILPDHDLGRRGSVFVPFFGISTATTPAVSVYAKNSNATVMMMDYYLDETSMQYVYRLGPPLENFPTDDKEADTARINQLIEQKIREHPEQYLWMHRRFKHRPGKDDPSLY